MCCTARYGKVVQVYTVYCIDMCICAPLYITVEISQKLLETFVQDLVACLKVSQLC